MHGRPSYDLTRSVLNTEQIKYKDEYKKQSHIREKSQRAFVLNFSCDTLSGA